MALLKTISWKQRAKDREMDGFTTFGLYKLYEKSLVWQVETFLNQPTSKSLKEELNLLSYFQEICQMCVIT